MSAVAIVMMIVSIAVVWGGLVVAIRFLVRHPLDPTEGATAVLDGDPDAERSW